MAYPDLEDAPRSPHVQHCDARVGLGDEVREPVLGRPGEFSRRLQGEEDEVELEDGVEDHEHLRQDQVFEFPSNR